MELAQRATILTPSLTLSIDSKAKAMKAEGLDVCGFGAGEPDFDTPEHIKSACMASLDAGFTKYTPSSGTPELRQAICDKFKADNGIDYKPSQIVVSNGAKHSCYNAILATCQPGDEVISGTGFNSFWEAALLGYGAHMHWVPMPRRIDDQQWRGSLVADAPVRVTQNGADRLAELVRVRLGPA